LLVLLAVCGDVLTAFLKYNSRLAQKKESVKHEVVPMSRFFWSTTEKWEYRNYISLALAVLLTRAVDPCYPAV